MELVQLVKKQKVEKSQTGRLSPRSYVLNKLLGGEDDFVHLQRALGEHGMGNRSEAQIASMMKMLGDGSKRRFDEVFEMCDIKLRNGHIET